MECEGSPQTLLSAEGLGAESIHTYREGDNMYTYTETHTHTHTHTQRDTQVREMEEDKKERSDRDRKEREEDRELMNLKQHTDKMKTS